MDLIVRWIKEYKRYEVRYEELKDIFLNNEKSFPYLHNTINKKWIYESIKKKIKDCNNEKIKEEFENEKKKLLKNIFLLEFFNSSLIKESNDLIEFILKKETTWLHIKAN
jgi:hypothetical protein